MAIKWESLSKEQQDEYRKMIDRSDFDAWYEQYSWFKPETPPQPIPMQNSPIPQDTITLNAHPSQEEGSREE